jgi:hypothetical protein
VDRREPRRSNTPRPTCKSIRGSRKDFLRRPKTFGRNRR